MSKVHRPFQREVRKGLRYVNPIDDDLGDFGYFRVLSGE